MTAIPEDLLDLLERPLFANLATVRPDGTPQVNPMWFTWDGAVMRFTHTDERQKYRNLLVTPQVAASISDPDNPYRFLEVRGVVEITPDHEGTFYREVASRYGRSRDAPPVDAEHRIVLHLPVAHVTWHHAGANSGGASRPR
jgi:PPOX class probable F420-dependent enzyme